MRPIEMAARRIVRHSAVYAPPVNTLQASPGETRTFRKTQISRDDANLQEFSDFYNGEISYKPTRSPDTEVEEFMTGDDVDSPLSILVSYTDSDHNDSYSSQGSVMYTDSLRARRDSESSVMSACDQVQYSKRLKEFGNMIAPCTEQGEYVYLNQVNGFTDKQITARYSDIANCEHRVRSDSLTKVKDIHTDYVNKTDKNGNLRDFSADMNIEEDDSNLKKIIQECLWYFHSQVESRRSQVKHKHLRSKTEPNTCSQRSFLHMDRRYRSRGQVPGHRPRSTTGAEEYPDEAARQRPRSVPDVQMLQCQHDSTLDNRKNERDVRTQGDRLSLVADVSGETTSHGSPHQSRVHTLPPRIHVKQYSQPIIRSDSSGNVSPRRKSHLSRRSKSSFGMFALPTKPCTYGPTQHDHVSTGRMFIEDILHDISDPKVTDVDDKSKTEGQYVELRKDIDNNDIACDTNHNKVSTPTVPNSGVCTPLIRSMSDFQGMTNTVSAKDNSLKYYKSLSADSFLPKTFPNFTKNSKFIRNLTENKVSSGLKQSVIGHNSDIKTEVEPAAFGDESSTTDLGVFDIVGEGSGCRYPWQRDACTQYEVDSVKMVESESSDNKNDSKINQGFNKSSNSIVKRQRVFRGQRPHSVGCIDTSTFDADFESISQLQNSARARTSEPFIQNSSFKKRSSQGTSEESGSMSNLESILENPAEMKRL